MIIHFVSGFCRYKEIAMSPFEPQTMSTACCQHEFCDEASVILDEARIFINNIPDSVTTSELENICSAYGEVISVDFQGGQSHGNVTFMHQESEARAITELNGRLIDNNILMVEKYLPKSLRYSKLRRNNIYLKNLPKCMDDSDLHLVFSAYGIINSAEVQLNDNGSSKGFGFVSYETAESAQKAINAVTDREVGLIDNDGRLYASIAENVEERAVKLCSYFNCQSICHRSLKHFDRKSEGSRSSVDDQNDFPSDSTSYSENESPNLGTLAKSYLSTKSDLPTFSSLGLKVDRSQKHELPNLGAFINAPISDNKNNTNTMDSLSEEAVSSNLDSTNKNQLLNTIKSNNKCYMTLESLTNRNLGIKGKDLTNVSFSNAKIIAPLDLSKALSLKTEIPNREIISNNSILNSSSELLVSNQEETLTSNEPTADISDMLSFPSLRKKKYGKKKIKKQKQKEALGSCNSSSM